MECKDAACCYRCSMVCLSVCLSQLWARQKWLNWPRYRLQYGLRRAQETVCCVGTQIPQDKGQFFGGFLLQFGFSLKFFDHLSVVVTSWYCSHSRYSGRCHCYCLLLADDGIRNPLVRSFVGRGFAEFDKYANKTVDTELLSKILIVKTYGHLLTSHIPQIRSRCIRDSVLAGTCGSLLWLWLGSFMIVYRTFLPSVRWCCWLGGRKGIRPVKNWVVGCWHGYLSGARCRLAYVPSGATATDCLLL